MPYVRSLPADHHPSFQEIKYLALPEASASARVAFGLLALLYLICEPEEPLPRFATPWDEWQELERRQTRHTALEADILRYWQEFQQDEAEKDLEELLWTEFLIDGDSDKVLRGEHIPGRRLLTELKRLSGRLPRKSTRALRAVDRGSHRARALARVEAGRANTVSRRRDHRTADPAAL